MVGWGTQRGGDNIVPYFRVPATTTSIRYPFTQRWQDGTFYFGSVRAVSFSGTNTTVTAPGQKLDETAPYNLAIVGPITTTYPTRFVTRHDWLRLKYTYMEPESFIMSVNISVSALRPNGTDLLFRREFGGHTRHGVDVALPSERTYHNQTVFVCTTLMNAAYLWSPVVCREFKVDKHIPWVERVVNKGHGETNAGVHTPATSYNTCLWVHWPIKCWNDVSDIDHYELRLTANGDPSTGRQSPFLPGPDRRVGPGATEVTPWRHYGLALSAPVCLYSFQPGWSYWASIKCITGSGLENTTHGASTVFDYSVPALVAVSTGVHALRPQRFTQSTSQVTASWLLRDDESELKTVAFAIGTCGAYAFRPESVHAFQTLGVRDVASLNNVTIRVSNFSLPLVDTVDYCVTIRAANIAGLVVTYTSPPMRVDLSPPNVVDIIRDGADRGRYYDAEWAGQHPTTVSVSWGASFDDREAPVVQFAWCAGFSPRACDVVPLTFVGYVFTASAEARVPLHGRRVWSTVWAYNDATVDHSAPGLNMSTVSDGVVYDNIPPSAAGAVSLLSAELQPFEELAVDLPFVRPLGYVPGMLFLSSLSSLRFRATGFNTSLAPLSTYALFIRRWGEPAGSGQLLASQPALTTGSVQSVDFPWMADGQVVSLTLVASHAGGAARNVSVRYGVGFDLSAPSFGGVESGGYMQKEGHLPLCVRDAGDAHSGIASVQVTVFSLGAGDVAAPVTGRLPGFAVAAALASPGVAARACANVSVPTLPQGVRLRMTVTLVNGAGLTATRTSPPFYSSAGAPQLRLVSIPPQRVAPALDGSVTIRLQWPAASDPAGIPCCTYTALVSSDGSLPSAARFPLEATAVFALPVNLTAAGVERASGTNATYLATDLRVPYAPAGRLSVWLQAANSLGGADTVAAQRAVVIQPRGMWAYNASTILRSGDVGISELLHGHQSVLTHPDTLTVLFDPGAPNPLMEATLHEVQLVAYYYSELWLDVVGQGLMAFVDVGLSRSHTFRGLNLTAREGQRTTFAAIWRVTYANGDRRRYVSPNSTVNLRILAGGDAAILGGAEVDVVDVNNTAFARAQFVRGEDRAIAVAWTGFGYDAETFAIAIGTQPFGSDVLPFVEVPRADIHTAFNLTNWAPPRFVSWEELYVPVNNETSTPFVPSVLPPLPNVTIPAVLPDCSLVEDVFATNATCVPGGDSVLFVLPRNESAGDSAAGDATSCTGAVTAEPFALNCSAARCIAVAPLPPCTRNCSAIPSVPRLECVDAANATACNATGHVNCTGAGCARARSVSCRGANCSVAREVCVGGAPARSVLPPDRERANATAFACTDWLCPGGTLTCLDPDCTTGRFHCPSACVTGSFTCPAWQLLPGIFTCSFTCPNPRVIYTLYNLTEEPPSISGPARWPGQVPGEGAFWSPSHGSDGFGRSISYEFGPGDFTCVNATIEQPPFIPPPIIQRQAMLAGLALPLNFAKPVHATVRGTDAFGTSAYAVSNASVLVTSPPSEFRVWNTRMRADLPAVDALDGAGSRYNLTASWVPPGGLTATAATLTAYGNPDVPSGLSHWEVALSARPADDGPLLVNWTRLGDAGAREAWLELGGSPPMGTTVFFLVAAVSRAGLRRVSAAAPQVLDPVYPAALSLVHPTVMGQVDVITASWGFRSLRNGRDLAYSVWVSTSPGSAVGDVFPKTSVGSLMSFTWDSLQMNEFQHVYITVEGCNALNRCAKITSTQSVRLLLGRPVATTAVAMTTADLSRGARFVYDVQPLLDAAPRVTSLHKGDRVWVAFGRFTVAPPTSVERYSVAVGDGPGLGTFGGCVLPNMTGNFEAFVVCSVTLEDEPSHQTRLWATATAFADSGVATSRVSEMTILVDRTEPSPFDVRLPDVLVRPPFWNVSRIAWTPSSDPESPPVRYEASIVRAGAGSGPALQVPWLPIPDTLIQVELIGGVVHLSAPFHFRPHVLEAGMHHVGVRAVNSLNMSAEAWTTTERLIVDPRPPQTQTARVADGPDPLADARFITPLSALGAFKPFNASAPALYANVSSDVTIDVWVSWAGFVAGSWIEFFEVGLGTSNATPNVAPLRRTTGFSSHVFRDVPAEPGTVLHGFVVAVNPLGDRSALVASDGAEVDLFSPAVADWVMAANRAALRLEAAAALSNASRYRYIFAPNPLTASDEAGDQALLDRSRPLMTAGLGFTAPAAIEGGTTCRLSNWPHEVMTAEPSNGSATNATSADAGRRLSAELPALGVTLTSMCAPGAYRTPFGACVPCPEGYYKPGAGDDGCARCPADTLDAAEVANRLILTARRRRVGTNATGATVCRCLDATQAFTPDQGCVCQPGFMPSAALADILDAWRGRGELLDAMCLPLTGMHYKPLPGDSSALVATCPPGTEPTGNHSSCLCGYADMGFDVRTARCGCSPGRYEQTPFNATSGVGSRRLNCTECPDGTFKPNVGDDVELCLPCPFGATHNRTRDGCEADGEVVRGAVMAPGGEAIACPPGTQYEADVSFVGGRMTVSAPRCEACPAGQVQPLILSLADVVAPGAIRHRCGACPGLQRGSYFASSIPDLFLDWTGVFNDGNGTGIAHFEVAVGSSVGGSQVVPFTRFPANATTAVLTDVVTNPGAPLFLTVVGVDRAGNGAIYEDVRPVFVDKSAPIPGLVLDGALEGFAAAPALPSSVTSTLDDIATVEVSLRYLEANSPTATADEAINNGTLYDLVTVLNGSMPVEAARALYEDVRRHKRELQDMQLDPGPAPSHDMSPPPMPTPPPTESPSAFTSGSPSRSWSGSVSGTGSGTASRSGTGSASATRTPTLSDTATRSSSATASLTGSSTASVTATPSNTASGTATRSSTATNTASITSTPTGTASITATPSATIQASLWQVTGDAAMSGGGQFPVVLTPDAAHRTGGVWTRTPLWVDSFRLDFRVQMGVSIVSPSASLGPPAPASQSPVPTVWQNYANFFWSCWSSVPQKDGYLSGWSGAYSGYTSQGYYQFPRDQLGGFWLGGTRILMLDLGSWGDVPFGATLTIDLCGSNSFDSTLRVGRGCPRSAGEFNPIAYGDDSCGNSPRVSFTIEQRAYYIVVGGYCETCSGYYYLRWSTQWPGTPGPTPSSLSTVSPSPSTPPAAFTRAGEGMALVLRGMPASAAVSPVLGRGGDGLGYEGIPRSVALRFDTSSGNSSTPSSTLGWLLNGTLDSPVGSVDTTASLPLWRRGGFDVTVQYAGPSRQMSVTLRSVEDPASSTSFVTELDLPAALGCEPGVQGCAAAVGFTAATSDRSAPHQLLSAPQYLAQRVTGTPSQTASQTQTSSQTSTSTGTPSQTATQTRSATKTATSSRTGSNTATASRTASNTATATQTPTRTPTATTSVAEQAQMWSINGFGRSAADLTQSAFPITLGTPNGEHLHSGNNRGSVFTRQKLWVDNFTVKFAFEIEPGNVQGTPSRTPQPYHARTVDPGTTAWQCVQQLASWPYASLEQTTINPGWAGPYATYRGSRSYTLWYTWFNAFPRGQNFAWMGSNAANVPIQFDMGPFMQEGDNVHMSICSVTPGPSYWSINRPWYGYVFFSDRCPTRASADQGHLWNMGVSYLSGWSHNRHCTTISFTPRSRYFYGLMAGIPYYSTEWYGEITFEWTATRFPLPPDPMAGYPKNVANGLTFALQGMTGSYVGSSGPSTGMGLTSAQTGDAYIALRFDTWARGVSLSTWGIVAKSPWGSEFYYSGNADEGEWFSDQWWRPGGWDVSITYDGASFLTTVQARTDATLLFRRTFYAGDIAGVLGCAKSFGQGCAAHVGFTAATGGDDNQHTVRSVHRILDFQYLNDIKTNSPTMSISMSATATASSTATQTPSLTATVSSSLWATVGGATTASGTQPFPITLTPAEPGRTGGAWTRARLWADSFSLTAHVNLNALPVTGPSPSPSPSQLNMNAIASDYDRQCAQRVAAAPLVGFGFGGSVSGEVTFGLPVAHESHSYYLLCNDAGWAPWNQVWGRAVVIDLGYDGEVPYGAQLTVSTCSQTGGNTASFDPVIRAGYGCPASNNEFNCFAYNDNAWGNCGVGSSLTVTVSRRFHWFILSGRDYWGVGRFTLHWSVSGSLVRRPSPSAQTTPLPAPGVVPGEGLALVVHRDDRGMGALGRGGDGLGYEGIARSFALRLDSHDGTWPVSTAGFLAGGVVNGSRGELEVFNVTTWSRFRGFRLEFNYSDVLKRAFARMTSAEDPSLSFALERDVDLPAVLGCQLGVGMQGCDATLGFVAATGTVAGRVSTHQVVSFAYLNAKVTFTPSQTASGTASPTASVTATPTMTSTVMDRLWQLNDNQFVVDENNPGGSRTSNLPLRVITETPGMVGSAWTRQKLWTDTFTARWSFRVTKPVNGIREGPSWVWGGSWCSMPHSSYHSGASGVLRNQLVARSQPGVTPVNRQFNCGPYGRWKYNILTAVASNKHFIDLSGMPAGGRLSLWACATTAKARFGPIMFVGYNCPAHWNGPGEPECMAGEFQSIPRAPPEPWMLGSGTVCTLNPGSTDILAAWVEIPNLRSTGVWVVISENYSTMPSSYITYDFLWSYEPPPPTSLKLGEGIALAIQRDPRGASALGRGGAELGVGGVRNAFGFAFDQLYYGTERHAFGPFYSSRGVPQSAPDDYGLKWGRSYPQLWTLQVAYDHPTRRVDYNVFRDGGLSFGTTVSVNLLAELGCPEGVQGCDAWFGVTAANGGTESMNQVELVDFSFVNRRVTGTPTQTGSGTQTSTPTQTGTPTPTASSSVGPAGTEAQLPALAGDPLTLFCPPGRNCSTALNLCRASAVNVKQAYAVFALGRAHGCAIDARSNVRCFGNNSLGQAPVGPLPGPFRHVAVVDTCSCGLLANGTIRCWGATGRVGCPPLLNDPSPNATGYRHFSLSTAGYLLAVRASSRSVECVGDQGQPGCSGPWPAGPAFQAVAAAGAAACALVDPEGAGGDSGGPALCFGLDDIAQRRGPFGSIVAAGEGTFCGLLSFLSMRAGAMDCWGASGPALMASLTDVGPFRQLSGSAFEPIVYAVNRSSESVASADAEYDATRGCAGARCACSPGSDACDQRAAYAYQEQYGSLQAPQSSGLTSATSLSCGVSCGFSVRCFGRDTSDPVKSFIPGWLGSSCAVAVPMDIGAPRSASPLTCNVSEFSVALQSLLAFRSPETCNLRGWWNRDTMYIEQRAQRVSLWPQAERYGSIVYRGRFLPGDEAVLTSLSPLGGLSILQPSDTWPVKYKGVGTFNQDCSAIVFRDGSRWDVSRRCAVRYLRITRGASAHPLFAPVVNETTGERAASDGQPALLLGDVQVWSTDGVNLAPAARLASSSLGGRCSGVGGACLRAAVDGNASSVFATAPAWGGELEGAASDPFGWLQLDFGREVFIARIVLRTAAAPTPAGEAPDAWGPSRTAVYNAAVLGMRVAGYDDSSFMPDPPQANDTLLVPAFTYRVAGEDLAVDPSRYEFANVHLACGRDPRTSSSATPTATASSTAASTATSSATPSGTPPRTDSPSGTGTRSRTPSRSPTRSNTGSATSTGSPTSSMSATQTGTSTQTPSQLPPEFQPLPSPDGGIGDGANATTNATNATAAAAAPYDWRDDGGLISLSEAPDVDFQASTDTLAIAWEPFEDVGSGVASVAFCLGSMQFACDVMPWVLAPSVKSHVDYAVISGLNLTAGSVVYAVVAAVNNVGLVSMTSSDGVFVDDRAPLLPRVVDTGSTFLHPIAAPGAGTVLYRPPVDINCDAAGAGVGAAWRDSVSYSGVAGYEWAVGTAPNATDILAWTPVGEAVAVFDATLRVPVGVTYFTSVRALGRNGRVSYASSDGVLVIDDVDAASLMVCLPSLARANVTGAAAAPGNATQPLAITFAGDSSVPA